MARTISGHQRPPVAAGGLAPLYAGRSCCGPGGRRCCPALPAVPGANLIGLPRSGRRGRAPGVLALTLAAPPLKCSQCCERVGREVLVRRITGRRHLPASVGWSGARHNEISSATLRLPQEQAGRQGQTRPPARPRLTGPGGRRPCRSPGDLDEFLDHSRYHDSNLGCCSSELDDPLGAIPMARPAHHASH